MRTINSLGLMLLIAYSSVLITIEWNTSQDYVRNYFCDIDGPVKFYAINTTLSVFLLWSTALMFIVCFAVLKDSPKTGRLRWFCLSQAAVFAFLGFDDRFAFHESAAWRLGIGDHFVLLAVAVAEVAFLLLLGGAVIFRRPAGTYLAVATVLFVVMIFIDACVPHDLVLRLTFEDLAKTWSALCFFLFSWEICFSSIRDRPPLADTCKAVINQ